MKIVLFKDVKSNYEATIEFSGEDVFPYGHDDTVVLSEPLEVEFTMLDNVNITNKQIAIIDKQMVKVRADAQAAITALEGKKQELLAIECKSEGSL